MAYTIDLYSQAHCVRCDAVLRSVNGAVKDGTISASQVTVHMLDGSEPRPGKVHPDIEVVRIENTDEQDEMRTSFRNHPKIGMGAPVFFLRDEGGNEVEVFNDFKPDLVKNAIQVASEHAPALAASA